MAECELSVLSRQALKTRINNQGDLEKQVQAWQKDRNQIAVKAN